MTKALFSQSRGTGPDLVLLHGWGLNSGVWEPVTHLLQQHFRVTSIDLPGFGRNAEQLPQTYTLDKVSEMVSEHLPSSCYLLGWSMGGLVAQTIAYQRPEQVEKLVLVASSPRFCEGQDWPGMNLKVLGMFEKQLERNFTQTLDRFLAIQALGSASAKADIRQIRQHVQQFPLPSDVALRAGLKLLSETDLRSQTAQLTLPTLRMFGRLDSLVPHQAIASITALQPDADVHVFAKASHAPFISHQQAFADTLIQWL